MARLADGREHLLTLALPLDVDTVVAISDALIGAGWTDVRVAANTHEVTGTRPERGRDQ